MQAAPAPSPERIDEVAKQIERTATSPPASDLKDLLGLPPDAALPPGVLDQLGLGGAAGNLGLTGPGGSTGAPQPSGASGLLNFLLGP